MSNIDIRYLEQAKHLLELGYCRDSSLYELAAKLQRSQAKRMNNMPDKPEETGDGVPVTVVDSTKSKIYK